MRSLLGLVGVLLFSTTAVGQKVRAHVGMENPQRHFFQVRLELSGFAGDELELVLPTWTPGSYKIRDFSRNVESFRAHDPQGSPLAWRKTAKNRWRLANAETVVAEYDCFALESSVRTSWLDDRWAFLMPGGVLPYVEGHKELPYEVRIHPCEGWHVDTALQELSPGLYRASDYDRLVDCPIQVGTHSRHDFEVDGTTFRLTLSGEHNMNVPAMVEDMAKVVGVAGEMFGGFPFDRYLFLTRFGGGGGLEHADSTALMSNGWRFESKDGWRGFLNLVAHEFFHAWNVKRIRDKVLGPFDYEKEVYTRLLWVHEGWTNYYAEQLLRRADIQSADDLRKSHERLLNGYLGRPGRRIQSLAAASFDAWIKYYQTNETSRNSTVSYYSHGQVAALCLDLILLSATAGERSLDDVLRRLWEDHAQQGEGIEEADVHRLLVEMGGEEARAFWDRHVVGVEEIDIADYAARAGLEWRAKKRPEPKEEEGEDREPWKQDRVTPEVGLRTRSDGPSLVVSGIERDSKAWEAGFDLGDELLAVGERRVSSATWPRLLREWKGQELQVTISRRDRLLDLALEVPGPRPQFELVVDKEADEAQKVVYRRLLRAPFPGDPKPDEAKATEEAAAEAAAEAGAAGEEAAGKEAAGEEGGGPRSP